MSTEVCVAHAASPESLIAPAVFEGGRAAKSVSAEMTGSVVIPEVTSLVAAAAVIKLTERENPLEVESCNDKAQGKQ